MYSPVVGWIMSLLFGQVDWCFILGLLYSFTEFLKNVFYLLLKGKLMSRVITVDLPISLNFIYLILYWNSLLKFTNIRAVISFYIIDTSIL